MPKKKKNSTVQKEIIGDSVKTFLFGDDATKMKTDTVGEWAVCVCCVCDDDSVERLKDTGTTAAGTAIIISTEDVLLHYVLSTQSTSEVPKS